MWKILNIIAALLAGGAAYVAFENKNSLMTEKALAKTATGNLEKTKEWMRDAGNAIKELQDGLATLTSRSEEAVARADKAQTELDAVAKNLDDVKARIATKQAEVDEKDAIIAEWGEIENLMTTVTDLEESLAAAKTSVADLEQSNKSKAALVENTEETIVDYQNLEKWQKSGKMESLNATVAMVSPEYQFVIIDAGNNRGVVSKTKLDVRRGGSKIGELRVAVLEPSRSVCNIESLAPGESIQPGDRVVVNPESRPTPNDTSATPVAPPTETGAPTPGPADAETEAPETAPADDAAGDPFGGLTPDTVDPGTDAEMPDAESPDTEMPDADSEEEGGAETGDAADPFGA